MTPRTPRIPYLRFAAVLAGCGLAADAAAALATCRAIVVLPNLRGLSTDTARALALHEGVGLVIGGFARLPDDVAAALAECRSLQGLLLPDLETLDSEPLARRLAQQDHVFLPRLTRLTPPIAATLAEGAGELSLPALERITPRALSALLRKADVEIPDVASLKLVPGRPTESWTTPGSPCRGRIPYSAARARASDPASAPRSTSWPHRQIVPDGPAPRRD